MHHAAIVLFLLITGCAPAVNMRPMTPILPENDAEFGVAWTGVGPRPIGEDETVYGGQTWVTAQPLTFLDISLVGAFAGGQYTAGLAVRWRAVQLDQFAAGLGAELGIGWAAVELPLAVKVIDRFWAYSSPQYGTWGTLTTVRVPLGLDFEVTEELRVRGEAQMNYPDLDPYQRRVQWGMGMAFRL